MLTFETRCGMERSRVAAYRRSYYDENSETFSRANRVWRLNHPDRKREADKHYRESDRGREHRSARTLSLHREMIDAYGGKCACCGEGRLEFLAIDHTLGNGQEHHEQHGEGTGFYMWLRREGFPQNLGLRVLCHNCNMAYGLYGSCPHQAGGK